MSLAPYRGVCPTCRHDHDRDDFFQDMLLAKERTAALAEVERLRADVKQGAIDYCELRDREDRLRVEVERLRGLLQHFAGSRRTVHCGSAVIKYEVGWNAESPIHEELMRAAYPPAVIPAVSKSGDA